METIQGKRAKRTKPKSIFIRKIVQLFFFLLIAFISINHTLAESGKSLPFIANASLHALCPFGGVVSIYQFAMSGSFVQKIHESSFVLMTIGFVLAVFFGPVFCGWVCPLGTAQEWVGSLGKRLFKKRFNHLIPERIDRMLRYTRYLVLAWDLHDRCHRNVGLLQYRSLFRLIQPLEQ
jgi:polyferredoxin